MQLLNKWQLIPNWRSIVFKSHSSRAILVLLFGPLLLELWFALTLIEYSPFAAFVFFAVVAVFGLIGRIIKQGISDA
jgi:hypothetical protein